MSRRLSTLPEFMTSSSSSKLAQLWIATRSLDRHFEFLERGHLLETRYREGVGVLMLHEDMEESDGEGSTHEESEVSLSGMRPDRTSEG